MCLDIAGAAAIHYYLSLDPDERTLAAMGTLGLDRNILWGSDFPHFDCTYRGSSSRSRKRS
jgi:hypothetical protein